MLYLHGIGHFHPENVISNRFLEELEIGTNEEWIMDRVGIRERRTVLPLDYLRETKNKEPRAAHEVSLYDNAELGAHAARMALERAGLKPSDIGMVVSGSSIPDRTTPAEASAVAAALSIEAPCFDLCSACSTFGMQLDMLNRMAAERVPRFILTVQTEAITRAIDFSDRTAAVLFGDGASAAVVSHSEKARLAVVETNCGTNAAACEKVIVPFAGHFRQDGHAVQGFAIRRMNESLAELKAGFPAGRPFRFIGHQANLAALRTVCERAGIPEERHWHNVSDFGNTGSSGAPAVLSTHWEELEPGDRVAICLVGAGLTWANLVLAVEA